MVSFKCCFITHKLLYYMVSIYCSSKAIAFINIIGDIVLNDIKIEL